MAIENRTQDYKSHKHNRTVYVDLNPKTKIGSDLIGQYHEQTRNLEENHPHRHHDPDCYRHHLRGYVVHVA